MSIEELLSDVNTNQYIESWDDINVYIESNRDNRWQIAFNYFQSPQMSANCLQSGVKSAPKLLVLNSVETQISYAMNEPFVVFQFKHLND